MDRTINVANLLNNKTKEPDAKKGPYAKIHSYKFFVNIFIAFDMTDHSTAIAILKKSEAIVKNTTAASKYIPRRPRISIN